MTGKIATFDAWDELWIFDIPRPERLRWGKVMFPFWQLFDGKEWNVIHPDDARAILTAWVLEYVIEQGLCRDGGINCTKKEGEYHLYGEYRTIATAAGPDLLSALIALIRFRTRK